MSRGQLSVVGAMVVSAVLALALPFQSAYAYSECTLTVSRIFSGDNGNIWVMFTNGGAAVILAADPDKQATLSLATTALLTGRTVTARYTGVPACSSTHTDVEGFWLN